MKEEINQEEDSYNNKENQDVSSSTSDGHDVIKKLVKIENEKSDVSTEQTMLLWSMPVVQNFILEADYALYQYMIEILLPCVRYYICTISIQNAAGKLKLTLFRY